MKVATSEEVIDALSHALRYDGRKRVHHANSIMARDTAERLVQHLLACGFVVMRKGEAVAPSAPTPYS